MDYKTKPGSPTAVLEHYGIKGMKWGIRRENPSGRGGSRTPKTDKIRDAEKARKLQARLDRNAAIDKARARVASGDLAREYKQAKAQYKVDKHTMGRREARKILREKKRELNTEYELSQELKSGAERTAYILTLVGGTILLSVASAAARR